MTDIRCLFFQDHTPVAAKANIPATTVTLSHTAEALTYRSLICLLQRKINATGTDTQDCLTLFTFNCINLMFF